MDFDKLLRGNLLRWSGIDADVDCNLLPTAVASNGCWKNFERFSRASIDLDALSKHLSTSRQGRAQWAVSTCLDS